MPELYARKVARLTEALSDPKIAPQAGEEIRSLIDRVVLTPTGDGLRAELFGDLAVIAVMGDNAPRTKNPGAGFGPGLLSVVAGARNHRDRHSLKTAI